MQLNLFPICARQVNKENFSHGFFGFGSLTFGEGWGEAKETLICLDVSIAPETADYFKANTNQKFICLERALDTTKKYNLKHYLGDKFNAF